jgi:hypothetical protein
MLRNSGGLGRLFGERTRPRVPSATPSSLTSVNGFSEGAEPCTRGRVRSKLRHYPTVSWLDFGGRRRQTAECNANDSLCVEYG